MIRDLFLSMIDPDFMQYPEILKSRHQYNELMKQSQSIDKYFRHLVMRDPDKQINNFGFQSLWFLTKTEMVNIFESIGQSMAHRLVDYSEKGEEGENAGDSTDIIVHPIVEPGNVKHMLRLILNNCAMTCIDSSNNELLKKNMYREMNEKKDMRIAFAWSETFHMRPGMDACEEFMSEIKMTVDHKYLLINADKDGILADDYDYFLIFGRTKDYASSQRPEYLLHQDIPFGGIASVLVPKDLIASSETYDNNGIQYMRIQVQDIILPIERYQVFDPEVDGVQANNYKGLVKLSMSALMIGQMKATMRDVHKYLTEVKAPLMSCDAVARATSAMITDIYVAESCLYYSTAMFDQLDQGLYPEIHLEAGLTSVLTHTAVEDFYKNAREIMGPTSKLGAIIDLNIILRDMMETEDFTRMKSVLDGLDYLLEQRGKWLGKFAVSPRIRERGIQEVGPNTMGKIRRKLLEQPAVDFYASWDLQGSLHMTFEREAKLLERVIKILAYCGEMFITANRGKVDKERLYDIYLLSNVLLTTFKLICCLSRASRSYSETLRNADMDVEMVKILADQIDYQILDMMEELEAATPGKRTHRIRANIAEYQRTGKAYYVTDPLDTLSKDERLFDMWQLLLENRKNIDTDKDLTDQEPKPKKWFF